MFSHRLNAELSKLNQYQVFYIHLMKDIAEGDPKLPHLRYLAKGILLVRIQVWIALKMKKRFGNTRK